MLLLLRASVVVSVWLAVSLFSPHDVKMYDLNHVKQVHDGKTHAPQTAAQFNDTVLSTTPKDYHK